MRPWAEYCADDFIDKLHALLADVETSNVRVIAKLGERLTERDFPAWKDTKVAAWQFIEKAWEGRRG